MTPPPRDRAARVLESFGHALIQEHVVTSDGLERALAHARESGIALQDALIRCRSDLRAALVALRQHLERWLFEVVECVDGYP